MKSTRISIIIPAYNEERYLPRCLDAIAAQTVKPYEVLVIDNNSEDATAAIAQKYPFVRVLREARQGIVFARNAGFDAASGDVLARIDADTVLPIDWLSRVQAFFTKNVDNFALTGGCYFYNLHSGRLTGHLYDLTVHHVNRLLIGYYFPWGGNMAMPQSVWASVQNEVRLANDVHEDLDLGICLHRAGYQVQYQSRLRVGARARRVLSERRELWPYLAMWPRTLKMRQIRTWWLVWPFVCLVWLGSYGLYLSEKLASVISSVTSK